MEWLIAGWLIAAFAALLIAAALRKRWIRAGRCPACGYCRTTLAAETPCPECGADASSTRAVRLRWAHRLASAATPLLAVGLLVGPLWPLVVGAVLHLPDRALLLGIDSWDRLVHMTRPPGDASHRNPDPIDRAVCDDEFGFAPTTGRDLPRALRDEVRTRLRDGTLGDRAAARLAQRWLDRQETFALVRPAPRWPDDEPVRINVPIMMTEWDFPAMRRETAVVVRCPEGTEVVRFDIHPSRSEATFVTGFFIAEYRGWAPDPSAALPDSAVRNGSIELDVEVLEAPVAGDDGAGWARLATRRVEVPMPVMVSCSEAIEVIHSAELDAVIRMAVVALFEPSHFSAGDPTYVTVEIDCNLLPYGLRLGATLAIEWLGRRVELGPLVVNRGHPISRDRWGFVIDVSRWPAEHRDRLPRGGTPWPADLPRPHLVVRGDPRIALRSLDDGFAWTGEVAIPLRRWSEREGLVDEAANVESGE